MADNIISKLSDTITNAIDDISDKAKEVSEVTALKGKVRSQKKIVENAYIEIGKQYYEAHKEETENDFSALMTKITDALAEIEQLEQDISNITQK